MSTQIVLTDGITTVTMPQVKAVSVSGEEVANETIMASGKMIKDVIGHRAVVNAEWDYVPAATMVSLINLLRQGGYFTVTYPDPDGTDKSGKFSVSFPKTKIFKFVSGVGLWHGVFLTMTAQEVV